MYRIATLTLAFLFLPAPILAQQATFEGLGDLPGGSFVSGGFDVSADGSVVVGTSRSEGDYLEPFVWKNGVMEGLGHLDPETETPFSQAWGVSNDGFVVVGVSRSENGLEAFRWDAVSDTMVGLGDFPDGDFRSYAYGVSADGSVVVGYGNHGTSCPIPITDCEAVRWEDGVMEGLGYLEEPGSVAYAVSADGSVVVGAGWSEEGVEAFRWEDGVMEALGELDGGGFYSVANAVTPDGSVVIGESPSADFHEAFRWQDGEIEGLGTMEGGTVSKPKDVSADGSVVVGVGSTSLALGNNAFIWTEEGGMRHLETVLEEDYGLETGWARLIVAHGVSDDGTVIVGDGINGEGNSEAFRVVLPPIQTMRYVATTGSDSENDCASEASPCATVTHAIGEAGDGDTIEIAGGVYTETFAIDKDLTLHGESEAGTIIQAAANPGEADSRVITIDTTGVGPLEVEITELTIRHGMQDPPASDKTGGGVFNNGASLVVTNVTLRENEAGLLGGGIHNVDGPCTLTNVTVSENEAGTLGGGIFNRDSSCTLTNVSINGNHAGHFGGGMVNANSSATLTNVTFSGNAAGRGGGMWNAQGSAAVLTNTIVWGNTASAGEGSEIYNDDSSSSELSYSLYGNEEGDIVEGGGFTAENSLTEDPLFVDIGSGDLHLEDTSPAIDTGDPATPDSIFVADEEGNPIDLDGNPRVFDGVIDLGAYEHQGTIADETSPERIAEVLSVPTPNPVRGVATFTVTVESGQDVTVEVFDALGRRVQTLYKGVLAAGTNETLTLDASALPAGVYVVRAIGEDFVETRRVTVTH